MNSQTVTVNLVPGLSTPAVVRVSQYDYGRPILFKVMDGTMPASFVSGTVATVVGTKPSGLGFSEVATISGNTASLDSTLAMTQECGMIPAEIRFSIQNGPDIGTANFILAVEPSPHPDGTTDGTAETLADLETRVTALENGGGSGTGITSEVKTALLNAFAHVAWVDANGQDYYDALESALNSGDLSVSLVLSQVSSSNSATTVEYGESYTTTLTADADYTLDTVTVTMGGVDITSTSYSSGTVSIASVTGNIVITATAASRPSNPYVTDNMTLWLDGIYNTATGHDGSATTWTNLITNDTFANTGITVGSDGMIFDGTAGHGFLGTAVSSPTTIEIVLDVTSPATTQAVINGYGNSDNGNISIKSNQILHKRGNYSDGQTHAISTGLHTHTFVVGDAQYVDGVVATQGTTTISFTATGKMAIGNALNANGTDLQTGSSAYPLTGNIKCIRFYSDALTAQEVASNFAVDASRFGIL